MIECEFCHKTYSNAYNLSVHKKTTKSCIRIQRQTDVDEESKHVCSYCNKRFTVKSSLHRHMNGCKKKNLEKELENTKKELEKVKKDFEQKLIQQKAPVYNINITNNMINALQVYSNNGVSNNICKTIDEETVKRGRKDVAYALAKGLSPFTLTSDLGRKLVVTKKEDGNLQKHFSDKLVGEVLKQVGKELLNICDTAFENEMDKDDRVLFNKHNVENRNNILSIKEDIQLNDKDKLNKTCEYAGNFLVKECLNLAREGEEKEKGVLEQDSAQVRDITSEFDELYDYSESE